MTFSDASSERRRVSIDTTVTIREEGDGVVVARDESTGITGVGSNVPTALTTLGERLERDLYQ